MVAESADNVDLEKLKKIVEGALFAAAKPMSLDQLGNLFHEDERPSKDDFKAVLQTLLDDYADRGVMLKEVSSGYRFQVTEGVGQWVSRLWEEKPARYSRALLETLALIAYRQPITRGEIEEIRGVSTSSHIMKTLQEREWIRIVGHRDVPGRPAMYATTRLFLDYFNLTNLDELPSLAEIRDLDEINRELDLKSEEVLQDAQNEGGDLVGSVDDDNAVVGDDGVEQSEETPGSTLGALELLSAPEALSESEVIDAGESDEPQSESDSGGQETKV
ncbi:MAG: SMC-Scp complex subunit ScpB [Pseudomonadales bacterium]|nr:SMC-Scp complex subunit ScpB [Pseudomonadales bacterium]